MTNPTETIKLSATETDALRNPAPATAGKYGKVDIGRKANGISGNGQVAYLNERTARSLTIKGMIAAQHVGGQFGKTVTVLTPAGRKAVSA